MYGPGPGRQFKWAKAGVKGLCCCLRSQEWWCKVLVNESKENMVYGRWGQDGVWFRWRHLHINRRPAQAVLGNLDVTQREAARSSSFIKYNVNTVLMVQLAF